MRDLLFFPCNGNTLEALDSLGEDDRLLGFVDDDPEKQGGVCLGIPVFGRDALQQFPDAFILALPGNPENFRNRKPLIGSLGVAKERLATLIHPQAMVSSHAVIGSNVYIGPGVVITGIAVIGDHVCILPNTVIHHDSSVGAYTLIGSNCTIAGFVQIGENAYVGSGSAIRDRVSIGSQVMIGMGSTVVSAVSDNQTVFGNPARPR